MIRVRTTHLELLAPEAFRPSSSVPPHLTLMQSTTPSPELNRFLYTAVGAEYNWDDRLPWTWQQWMDWLSRPEVEVWVLYERGTPAGYFELEAQGAGVEITYFGLLPGFTGRGLGRYLLTQAVHQSFAMNPGGRRVWVHTCTLDHPAALAGYLGAGFAVFKEEDEDMTLAEPALEPWPGAERPR